MTALDPLPDLFRREAREHKLRGIAARDRLQISPPWSWWLLWSVVALLAVALVVAFGGSVEVNSRAIAILRPIQGVRILTSQVGGMVSSVDAQSGQTVRANDIVITLDAPDVQGQLLQAQREVDLLKSDFAAVSARQQSLYVEQVASVNLRIASMNQQVASLEGSLAGYEHKWKAMQSLAKNDLVSDLSVEEAREALAQAKRQLASAHQGLEQARQELAALTGRREAEVWQNQQSLDRAVSHRDALKLVTRQGVVRAPQAGSVEAVLVAPGDVVKPGDVLGKLVPHGAPLRVVSFLPEKDRAFVKIGDAVRLELDQLPYGEYGSLGARVIRVSDDLASPHEITNALGEGRDIGGPAYRVELEVFDTAAARSAGIRLRSGMLMQARFTLRHQRPITLLLEPLQRWFR